MRSRVRKRHEQWASEMIEVLSFFGHWVRRPRSIGAVAPSGDVLARAMAREIDFDRPGLIVELGGGTGSITRALVERAADPHDIVVIEREESMASRLARRFPETQVICGDARDLPRLLRGIGAGEVKAVVSGLPLLSLPPRLRYGILRQAVSVLAPDGVLLQFTYGLTAPVGSATATRIGIRGERSGYVVRNLPPASLWRYRREAAPSSRRHARPAPQPAVNPTETAVP